MYGCESWTIKKAEHRRIDSFELWCWRRLLRVPGQQGESFRIHWIFFGRTDAQAEAPMHWPPDVKSWLIRKDPDAGKDWRQEEKGPTEDEMVGWHHQLNGHEFEQALGVGDGQGGLVCCSPWGHKESDTTELNWGSVIHIPCTNWFTCCTWWEQRCHQAAYPGEQKTGGARWASLPWCVLDSCSFNLH